jgi:hypothetical protein
VTHAQLVFMPTSETISSDFETRRAVPSSFLSVERGADINTEGPKGAPHS